MLRSLFIRLLDERAHDRSLFGRLLFKRFSRCDVAIGCRRGQGPQANRDNVALLSDFQRTFHAVKKNLRMSNRMVSREGSNRSLVTKALANDISSQTDSGHRIAPLRLNKHSNIKSLGDLSTHGLFMCTPRNNRERSRDWSQTINGLLEQALSTHAQVKQKFRPIFTRERPQPRAHSPCGNNDVKSIHTSQCNKKGGLPNGKPP